MRSLVAQLAATDDIDWLELGMGLAGGLVLFLLGMSQVTDALKAIAGDRLRWTLAKLSTNRMTGAATGTVVTAVIQSSSVTTVLVVGFVAASLLSVVQAAPVIIGANLGTTVTAQVIALDITDYALGLLAVGAIVGLASGRDRVKQIGKAIVGLGFVFLGMDTMSEAMAPLGTYEPFLDLVADSSSPIIGLLIGMGFTALVQSSSATTGIVVVMAGDGLLDLETGIAIILGANIGTCVTALLAAVGKSRDALRAAMVHVLVNVFGAVGWIFLIGQLAEVVRAVTADPSVSEGAIVAAASPQQLANAHTFFNLANTVVFLILLKPLVALATRIVPAKRFVPVPASTAAFLEPDDIGTPVLALEGARNELMRMGLHVRDMLQRALPAAISGSRADLAEIASMDDEVDALHAQVVAYLGEVSKGPLDGEQRRELLGLLDVANELEHLADLMETNLVAVGEDRIDKLVTVSPATGSTLDSLHESVLDALDTALAALGTRDADAAKRVINAKPAFKALERSTTEHLAGRLAVAEPLRVEAYSLEVELVESMRLVHAGCRRIARAVRRAVATQSADPIADAVDADPNEPAHPTPDP